MTVSEGQSLYEYLICARVDGAVLSKAAAC